MSKVTKLVPQPMADDAIDTFWDTTINGWKATIEAIAEEIRTNPADREDLIIKLEKLTQLAKSFPEDQ